ncbi:MurR/RpiR family transcriptional regulator [Faecalicatena acetigenes]|uniref:MurR/RpiR family transcriptional regulator n=1 Tax=Faecalicatena acetigenes TaxID=2981790 RepID=A0ABT2TEV1_9FIRM|nr:MULTISPECIES: MurR/RpiR family transcriptional regulator [Lachnospiraceae]MCU6748777.1 MurR/RpiR family transcriptional regulator [Faecalicatena acetigenes]SCI64899.1 DNA-binding transcriptional regulator HexR [uncultured Clostridium sp.]
MKFDLLERIEQQSSNFTKVLTKIAAYVKKEYLRIPFLSIQEISSECGVSATSIHRFCTSLGYSGYSELQKVIQVLMQKELVIKETETYRGWGKEEGGILKKQIESNTEILKEMYTEDLNENFLKAAGKIKNARRVYILGLREAYSVAFYLYHLLSDYMDNVILLTIGVDDIYDRIANVKEGDVLVAIGFKAYTKNTVDVIRYFHSQKASTIALTDLYTSPLAIQADISLIPGNKTPSYGYVMAVTIIKALSVEVLSLHKNERMNENFKQKEELLKAMDIYTE